MDVDGQFSASKLLRRVTVTTALKTDQEASVGGPDRLHPPPLTPDVHGRARVESSWGVAQHVHGHESGEAVGTDHPADDDPISR